MSARRPDPRADRRSAAPSGKGSAPVPEGDGASATQEVMLLAADYVLDLLPPDARLAFEARLSSEPALSTLVGTWRDDPLAMQEALSGQPLPAATRRALRARLWDDPPVPQGLRGFIASLGIAELVIGTAAAAALAFLAWETGLMSPRDLPYYRASLGGGDDPVRYEVAFDPDAARLSLQRLGLPAPEGQGHHFWLVAGDAAPISLLAWPGQAERQVIDLPPPLARLAPGADLRLTLEPAPGSAPASGLQPGQLLAEDRLSVQPD
ncbi:anti-sigma factor domain-containing protein [Oceanicola sp. S124]|uniref:anti-sigma factor domain-containing protein n=1 Tax=Oceanicola sp. S124 TaxID=1042378 RepID=UPI0002557A8E|nr:hypothetical protein [Oceanicola sp. S124]